MAGDAEDPRCRTTAGEEVSVEFGGERAEARWAEEKPAEDFADDAGLMDAREERTEHVGGDDEEPER